MLPKAGEKKATPPQPCATTQIRELI